MVCHPWIGFSRRGRPRLFSLRIAHGAVLAAILVLGGCGMRSSGGFWSEEKPRLGPRIVPLGQPVPKGGGRYKVGAPYRLNGKLYTPREVESYDETGVASWYGELFHGRRTANGEIYDMEALTAAHPILPMPSYARVTNLANGRSLVVRVNDRGPYARNRIIDLSWAVASLLKMDRAGTAPVRVQYLGRAPLNGDDSYERAVLARQPWAGPRVAYAASPAKAARRHGAVGRNYSSRPQDRMIALAEASGSGPKSAASPTSPAASAEPVHLAARMEPAKLQEGKPQAEKPGAGASTKAETVPLSTASTEAAARLAARAAKLADASIQDKRGRPGTGFYVEAGVFTDRAVASQLADILKEVGPASVETLAQETGSRHRIRLGPFAQSEEARAAAARIRAAGLKEARVEGLDGS